DHVGLNIVLLDQLFGQLLADFSPTRRGAVETFFAEVSRDQALLPQLTPEGMEVFNATTRDRPGVRYGSVVTRARPPGVRSTLAAQADHLDVIGHFRDRAKPPRHTDWLTTGSGFDAEHFEVLWADVAGYALGRR